MTPSEGLVQDWTALVRAEYQEVPDLLLTRTQFERFWAFGPETAERVLDTLMASGFLRVTRRGAYVRAS
jgi:hypothetical protein